MELEVDSGGGCGRNTISILVSSLMSWGLRFASDPSLRNHIDSGLLQTENHRGSRANTWNSVGKVKQYFDSRILKKLPEVEWKFSDTDSGKHACCKD